MKRINTYRNSQYKLLEISELGYKEAHLKPTTTGRKLQKIALKLHYLELLEMERQAKRDRTRKQREDAKQAKRDSRQAKKTKQRTARQRAEARQTEITFTEQIKLQF